MEQAYTSFYLQVLLFVLLGFVLIVCAVSIFINPARRIIRASLVNAKSGHIFDISAAETSIGRAKTCDIVLPDVSVSRFHAVLSMRKKSWMIFDTNSSTGVYVNGNRIEKKCGIKDGDEIKFGEEKFIFYGEAVTTKIKQTNRENNGHSSNGKTVKK